MKILILVDLINNWALHNRGKAIKKFLPEHEIEIMPSLGNDMWRNVEVDYDIIHFNFTYGITAFTDFIIKNKNRCLITIVNERSLLVGHGVDLKSLKLIVKECPYFTAVNQKMAQMVNGVYIPNGIDTDLFDIYKKPIVGFSGTDRDAKNMLAVMNACEELNLDFRKSLYNSGKPDLPHDAMKKFYIGLDVYVHASLTEGFNNTVIEALACNIPVLMTKEGAWESFTGYVDFIEPTVSGVKEGLKRFVPRRYIVENFNWKNIVPQYLKAYERIYADNKRV